MSQLTKIQEAGNLLKDTKFYNLRIDKTLKCHLEVAKMQEEINTKVDDLLNKFSK